MTLTSSASVFGMPLSFSLCLSVSLSHAALPRSVVMSDPTEMEVARGSGGGNETANEHGPYPSLSPEVRASLAVAFGKPFV